MSTEPGPRMTAIVRYVAGHPGCSKSDAARGGPLGTTTSLYLDSVYRAIRRGFVREESLPGHLAGLYVTSTGRKLISLRGGT